MTPQRGPIASCTLRPTASVPRRRAAPGTTEPETTPFVQRVDVRIGAIHAQGRLDARGVDTLSGALAALQSTGFRRVVLDLGDAELVDAAAGPAVHGLRDRMAERGLVVVVVRAPWSDVATSRPTDR